MAATRGISQPRWVTLVRFAARKVSSVLPKTSPAGTGRQVGQCHRARATTRKRVVVMRNVPVKATR